MAITPSSHQQTRLSTNWTNLRNKSSFVAKHALTVSTNVKKLLLQPSSMSCLFFLSGIFKHLIVEHTVCSSAIIGNATTHNIDGELIDLERKSDDQLLVDGKAKIVEADIIATNGVVHLLDTIIIPESGTSYLVAFCFATSRYTKHKSIDFNA